MIKIKKSIELNNDGILLANIYVAVDHITLDKNSDNTYNVTIFINIYKDSSAYINNKHTLITMNANLNEVDVSNINEALIFTVVKDKCVDLFHLTESEFEIEQVTRTEPELELI